MICGSGCRRITAGRFANVTQAYVDDITSGGLKAEMNPVGDALDIDQL